MFDHFVGLALKGLSYFHVAWDMDIVESNLKVILTANIFLRTDKIIIGRRFHVDSFSFPGFCSALKVPCVISIGCFLVTTILMPMSAIFSYITSGEHFISSILI